MKPCRLKQKHQINTPYSHKKSRKPEGGRDVCMRSWMSSNKTTISVTMATGELKPIHTLKQRVSNNKHPPYKYANQAYLLMWVGSREGQWQTTHQWIWFSSDNGWIVENKSSLAKQEKTEAHGLSWFEIPVRILVRMSGFTNPWGAIASNLCDLFTVHFRAFGWSDSPPKVFRPK